MPPSSALTFCCWVFGGSSTCGCALAWPHAAASRVTNRDQHSRLPPRRSQAEHTPPATLAPTSVAAHLTGTPFFQRATPRLLPASPL